MENTKSSSSSEEKQPPMFGLYCSDGVAVKLDMKCFYESRLIYQCLARIERRIQEEEEEEVPNRFLRDPRDISYVGSVTSPSDIILLVNTYCVGRYNILRTYDDVDLCAIKLREFDSEFIQDLLPRPRALILLFNAAVQMRIKSLINLVLNTVYRGGPTDASSKMPDIEYSKSSLYASYLSDVAAVVTIEDDSC